MDDKSFILRSFSLFFRHNPKRLLTLFLVTLFLGFNQGITILLLIPLLNLLNPLPAQTHSGRWVELLDGIINRTGFGVSLESILVLFACCLILIAVLHYYQAVVQSTYQQEFSFEIRKRLYQKMLVADWTFFHEKSKFSHLQVLTSEIPKMGMFYYYYLGLATKLIFIAIHIALAACISATFTLFVVTAGTIVFVLLRGYLRASLQLGNMNNITFRSMLKHIDDFWSTVKLAKVHHSESFYFQKFVQSSRMLLTWQNRQALNRAVPQLLFTLAALVVLTGVVYAEVVWFELPFTTLFVLILLFGRIFPQFMAIHSDLNQLVSNVSSVKMVLQMDREMIEKEIEKNPPQGRMMLEHELEIKNLSFAYDPDRPLFVNFSAKIPAHATTGILGASGCGKTTLIDLIAGLHGDTENTIFIDGTALSESRLPLWQSKLGYLPQDPIFVDGTLRENLIWDSQATPTDSELTEILIQVNAVHLVDRFAQRFDAPIVNYAHTFSAGERQRLALARVLIRRPELLLLDEATSALDTQNEQQIMELLTQIKQRVTILFVTHRTSLKPYFDSVIDLNNGSSEYPN